MLKSVFFNIWGVFPIFPDSRGCSSVHDIDLEPRRNPNVRRRGDAPRQSAVELPGLLEAELLAVANLSEALP